MISLWTNAVPWGERSPRRLYELLEQFASSGLPAELDDEFAKLLMGTIDLVFRSTKLRGRLRNAGIDPQDVAQDLIVHLRLVAAKRFGLRELEYGSSPWLPMLRIINVSILRFCSTEMLRARKRRHREACATDVDARRQGGDPTKSNRLNILDSAIARDSACPTGLVSYLEGHEDAIIGDLADSPAELAQFQSLYRAMGAQLAAGERPADEFRNLPPETRAMIISRVIRFATAYAGGG